MKEKIRYVFYGLIMGSANVIPGVSGGTMAIILNFYDKLMESITFDLKIIKKNLGFLIPLGLGVILGIAGLSKLLSYLLETYQTQTYVAFIGIIFGSLPLIYAKAKYQDAKLSKSSIIAFITMLVLMLVLAIVHADKEGAAIAYKEISIEAFFACLFASIIAASTMIIPGISGSLMLLIMGMYGTIYGYAIPNFNIPLLIPIVLGIIIGIFGGAKLITYFLKRFEQLTYMAILGLLIGSVFELIKRADLLSCQIVTILTSLLAGIIMFIIVYFFSKAEIKRDKGELR